MPTLNFQSSEQLIEALEARRPWAKERDRRILAAHQADERDKAKEFKDECRRFSKMTYDDLKAASTRRRGSYISVTYDVSSCPTSNEASLDKQISYIKLTRQTRFSLSPNGTWDAAFRLLTDDDDARLKVC